MSTKVNLPIDWCKVLPIAGVTSLVCLVIGGILHIRVLLMLADILIIGTILASLCVAAVAAIKLFSSPSK